MKIEKVIIMLLALSSLTLTGCQKVKTNQQVLISGNCGESWRSIPRGEGVPTAFGNPCFMRVSLPNYPMQGDMKFVANMEGRVRVETVIDYDYSIVDAMLFIQQAKFLGKDTSRTVEPDTDETERTEPSQPAMEQAENAVIDKRIKDVAKEYFVSKNIVDLDQLKAEDELLSLTNKELAPYGVKLNFITLTLDLDAQTRQAVDIASALKIYKSGGLENIAEKAIVARAGASNIHVELKERNK